MVIKSRANHPKRKNPNQINRLSTSRLQWPCAFCASTTPCLPNWQKDLAGAARQIAAGRRLEYQRRLILKASLSASELRPRRL
jgi:hypothetical protein